MVEVKRFVLLDAPVSRAWSALTNPEELKKWFCEEASVALERDGHFQIESRVPNTTGEHRIILVESERLLSLDWKIQGHSTEAVLRLEDMRGLTRLTALHRVPDNFAAMDAITDSLGNAGSGLDYLWCYAFLLLKSYLRDDHTQLRLKPQNDPLSIEWQCTIEAPAPDVFHAVTDPSSIKKWNPWVGDAVVELREGGRYSFGWKSEEQQSDGPDRIVEFKDGCKVTYTWHGQEPKTLVSWTCEPLEAGRTRLHFQHSGFLRNTKAVHEYKLGWAHFLYSVKVFVETGQSMNEWNGSL